jgi:hypothetical protein
VPRLGDDERRARADEAARFPQDHLEVARIVVGRQLARPIGRLDLVEAHDPSLGLRDGLLGQHDDVAVLELHRRRDEGGEIVTLAHLRNPAQREDPQLSQAR